MQNKVIFFEFTSYKFEPEKKRIFFNYKTEFKNKKQLFFTETVILPKIPDTKSLPKELLAKLLEGLHIILGVSYYKLYCSHKIKLPYRLSKQEASFWQTVYKKGLGEFFYKNDLDPKTGALFQSARPSTYSKISALVSPKLSLPRYNRYLVGIGGGKDSIVVAELFKKNKFDITGFAVSTNKKSPLIDTIVKKIGIKDLKIKRILDKKVFDKHQYNGHIPISAIYAYLGIFAAVLYKYSYFIVGNEYSSNFGNLKYKGQIINHQWSKSFEFEKLFQDYVKNFISPDIFYFSLLRPFYEIRVVKMFSELKKYFTLFSSCNSNFKIKRLTLGQTRGKWCNQCPKCVFVFILLSAFLTKKELINIFSKNLYEDKNLLPLFKDVLGFGKVKPFDCVGTFEEAQTAFFLAKDKFNNSFITHQLSKRVKYYKEVFRVSNESCVPEQFKFLGMEKALILGYGKEGKVTKRYLKKYWSKLKTGIADQKQESDYLKKQEEFDIAVKSPGIPKKLVTIPYTTATNIFFSKVKGRNLIIGVTGSKGKSTTSSLIYEILKETGKKVELLGNIGKPMLERLLKPLNKNTIFVLELSSAQLDDLKQSPDIAVVTNLFPEHMDYHGTVNNYYQAKKNIINFQNKDNYFVFNQKTKGWLKNYLGKAVPFARGRFKSNLLGKQNQNNIKAAVTVSRILKISEKKIKKTVESFKSLPHRLEFVGQFKRIKFYDDGSSTNPESAIMAIKSLKEVDTIFLGGQERGYDFLELEKTIKKYKINNIVLFPDSGDKIIKEKKAFNILKTSSMKEAVKFAYKNTKKEKICLLSGASPSYSLWKNFNEKGNQFQLIVKKLAKNK